MESSGLSAQIESLTRDQANFFELFEVKPSRKLQALKAFDKICIRVFAQAIPKFVNVKSFELSCSITLQSAVVQLHDYLVLRLSMIFQFHRFP